jgi:hypothetical protein
MSKLKVPYRVERFFSYLLGILGKLPGFSRRVWEKFSSKEWRRDTFRMLLENGLGMGVWLIGVLMSVFGEMLSPDFTGPNWVTDLGNVVYLVGLVLMVPAFSKDGPWYPHWKDKKLTKWGWWIYIFWLVVCPVLAYIQLDGADRVAWGLYVTGSFIGLFPLFILWCMGESVVRHFWVKPKE